MEITPPGGVATDVSVYVAKIDAVDSVAIKGGQFEVDLWDRDGKGFATEFPVGSTVQIWADTTESASDVTLVATLSANTPALVPVKAWGAVANPPAGLQTRGSLDGVSWGPWQLLGAGNAPQTPPFRWIEASAACSIYYKTLLPVMTGTLLDPVGTQDGPNGVVIQLKGDNWVVVMLNRKVSGKWYAGDGVTNGAADVIIKQIVANFFPGELTTNHVQAGAPQVQYEYARRKTAFDVLNDLSLMTGWIWWIDTNKDIHWAPPTAAVHPVVLDVATTIVRGTMQAESDGRKLVNKVTFWGGRNVAAQTWTDTFTGDGYRRTWGTTYPVHDSFPIVSVNGGPAETVAFDQNNETAEWYYQLDGSYFRQDPSQTVLGKTDTVSFTYQYTIPLIEQMQSDASIASYGTFEQDIIDQKVADIRIARQRMQAVIDAWAQPIQRVQCDSWETSYQPGGSAAVNAPKLGLNKTVLTVLECHHQITPDEYQLTVTLGTVQGGGAST